MTDEQISEIWQRVSGRPFCKGSTADVFAQALLLAASKPAAFTVPERLPGETFGEWAKRAYEAQPPAAPPAQTAVVLDDERAALIERLKQFKRTRHGESIWLGDGVNNAIKVDELIAALSAASPQPVEQTRALDELRNIAKATRFNREYFADDTAFADWAQSRARALLAAAQPASKDGS